MTRQIGLLEAQKGDSQRAEMIRRVSEHQDEERVQRNDPEDVLEEHQGAVEAEQTFPCYFFGGPVPLHWYPVVVVSDHVALGIYRPIGDSPSVTARFFVVITLVFTFKIL